MRLIGAALLTLGAYLIGKAWAKEEGCPLTSLDAVLNMLRMMRRRISFELMPLDRFFIEFEDAHLEAIGFLPTMRSHRGALTVLWQEALECIFIDPEAERELSRLGLELGRLPLDEQEKRIDACVEALTEIRVRLCNTIPQKQKCIKTVCTLAGLLVSIIFL